MDVRDRVRAAVSQLPEELRVVVLLYDVEGYQHNEIADMMGITAGACRMRLLRAHQLLRTMLPLEREEWGTHDRPHANDQGRVPGRFASSGGSRPALEHDAAPSGSSGASAARSIRTGLLLLAGIVIAAAVLVRTAIRASSVPVVVPVAADSISENSPVERSMTQETRREVPSNLIPLLGHRTQLTMDIRNLQVSPARAGRPTR